MPDARDREADHPLGDAAGGHERAGQDEERDGEQREMLRRLEQLERQRGERIAPEHEDRHERRQAERDGDRHADQHEGEQQDEEHRGGHDPTAPSPVSLSFIASAASSTSFMPS